ncbi:MULTISPECIES: MurR/RpiR family transcriptional regulator [Vibrio]|uniref:MurR/RpiR family transcriptional regulator n=1 Tax=Vibrio TaxID=662 RepID=UPI00079C4A3B|nr:MULTISPECIES: MurR/RpiR family transcriptional regulator [Vibrio]KXZ36930.1 N-acetylmannosamine kinase [Vibrio alginolyticus]MDW2251962.1 MurR/RpiR family transcriptional regulator [Vibrio sp. 1569]WMN51366.1 MurR/RpiR family transcriptional regulator [Vibrio alginolyticus]
MAEKNDTIQAGKILDTIGSLYDSFTPASKRIADFVLAKPSEAYTLSIAELSQAVSAGDASIIRFCRSLGVKGFHEFKMALAIELSQKNKDDDSIFDTDVTSSDKPEVIGKKLQKTIDNVLSETLNLLDLQKLSQVSESIKQAKSVYFLGVGSSGISAENAKYRFMRIGLNVDALTTNHYMYMKAALLTKGDVAIGISHSGQSSETAKALKIAKQSGATTVAVTHNPRSSICEYADYILINGNRQGQLQGDSIGTKISQLFVLDMIYCLLVQGDESNAYSSKLRTTQALSLD